MKLEQLLEILARIEERDNQRKTMRGKALKAGYTEKDIAQFVGIGESMEALIETLTTATHIAELRRHVPSARYALQSMEYVGNASNWLYAFLNKSEIDPGSFGWRDNGDELTRKIAEYKPKMEAIIQEYERREAFAKEVDAND